MHVLGYTGSSLYQENFFNKWYDLRGDITVVQIMYMTTLTVPSMCKNYVYIRCLFSFIVFIVKYKSDPNQQESRLFSISVPWRVPFA